MLARVVTSTKKRPDSTYPQAASLASDAPTRRLQGIFAHIQNTAVWETRTPQRIVDRTCSNQKPSLSRKDFVVPLAKLVAAFCAFSVAVPRIWNLLQPDVTSVESVPVFCKETEDIFVERKPTKHNKHSTRCFHVYDSILHIDLINAVYLLLTYLNCRLFRAFSPPTMSYLFLLPEACMAGVGLQYNTNQLGCACPDACTLV